MFEAVESLVAEHAELEQRMADPAVHADPAQAKKVGRRYAELTAVLRTYREWQQVGDDLEAARELELNDEIESLEERLPALAERLQHLLVPRDPADGKDVIVEIKGGEGGEESALFAGDLLRMYTRFAEQRGWRTEVLDATESALGGYKSVTVGVQAGPIKGGGTPEPGEAPFALLKFEGGVHRVQRVPVTESQGRIHTSAAGVFVMPEAEDVDVEVNDADLRIDVFRSSGPGGQSVNTTDSAVRITHEPTGIVVSCQNEKSQLQNKEQAMRILRARLLDAAQATADAETADARKSQVRTVDRSERVRTYNFPENRVTDHRTGFKAYNLDQVMDGALDDVIASLVEADLTQRLAGIEDA
jgi:peptide chain release factor 1